MPAWLSNAEIAHYRSEGYVKGIRIRVLGPAELDELREEIPSFRWILLCDRCRRSNIPTLPPLAEDRVPIGYNQFGSDDD